MNGTVDVMSSQTPVEVVSSKLPRNVRGLVKSPRLPRDVAELVVVGLDAVHKNVHKNVQKALLNETREQMNVPACLSVFHHAAFRSLSTSVRDCGVNNVVRVSSIAFSIFQPAQRSRCIRLLF